MSKFRALLLLSTAIGVSACGADDIASPGEGNLVIVTPPTTPAAATPAPARHARRELPGRHRRPRRRRHPARLRAADPLHPGHRAAEPARRRLLDRRAGQCRHRRRRRRHGGGRPGGDADRPGRDIAVRLVGQRLSGGQPRLADQRGRHRRGAGHLHRARQPRGHGDRQQPGPVGRRDPARPRADQRLQHRRRGRLGQLPAGDRGHDRLLLRRRPAQRQQRHDAVRPDPLFGLRHRAGQRAAGADPRRRRQRHDARPYPGPQQLGRRHRDSSAAARICASSSSPAPTTTASTPTSAIAARSSS